LDITPFLEDKRSGILDITPFFTGVKSKINNSLIIPALFRPFFYYYFWLACAGHKIAWLAKKLHYNAIAIDHKN
jgi:hypothetical protein